MKKGKKKILHPPALPPMSLSFEGTRIIKTGTWRYLTPVYLDKLAPCNEGCPAGEDIEAAMVRASQRDFGGAWEKITEENPLPRVCGRVCFHPCEGVCNRKEYDEALAIHLLERLAGDQAFLTGRTFRPPRETRKEKVAIVGSGPAGLSCAYHLATMGYRVTLYEGERELGGMLRYGIPAYRLPKDVLDQEIRNILALGIEARTGAFLGREVSWKELENYDALFLATGAWKSIPLKIPGADAKGVRSGLQVLREINQGRKMDLGQRAAIIGGGNTAIDVARSALRLGAKALILYRRSEEEMPAWGEEIQEAKEEGVEFIFLTSPVKILTERGSVRAIECLRNELGPPGPDGRRQPRPVEGSHFTLPVDSVIPCIGETSDLSFLPEALQNPGGMVAVDETGATVLRKIFAGGDLVPQPRTVAYAVGSGKRAAMAIDAMLQGKNVTEALRGARVGEKGGFSMARYRQPRPDGRPDGVVRFSDLNPAYFKPAPRQAGEKLPVATRIDGFGEVQKGLTVEAAWEEAKRCFNCGVCNQCDNCFTFCPDMAITVRADLQGYQIDLDHCKGCCICVAECPRGAISVEGKK
jgi:NADPH-dependent glutamate synthase beta subunit-like oxidoreductase